MKTPPAASLGGQLASMSRERDSGMWTGILTLAGSCSLVGKAVSAGDVRINTDH